MPLPDRPVSHASIESVWGQQVHDYTFAPAGCTVSGAASTVNATVEQLNLDVGDDDPGGYLDAANNRLEVPTNGAGFYTAFVRGNAVNGTADTTETRFILRLNGSDISTGINTNQGGTNVTVPVTWMGDLVAGDQLTVWAQRKGASSSPAVTVLSFTIVRLGAELGAP